MSESTKKIGPKSDPELLRKNAEGQEIQASAIQNQETEFFNKHYNKELRVAKDEIPIVLAELNESAIAFIKKEQYERALNLLQKAYGIMDAIDFTNCKRDIYHLFIMFHNMALCYQKMQLLEECAQCIEHAFEHLPISLINLEEKSISYRMRKVYIIGKLKLQYCAILSQIHRHKDALDQAREGVKICHQMINDMHQLCQFYVQREKLNNQYKDNQQANSNYQNNSNQQLLDEYSSRYENKKSLGSQSRNRSFSSFLSQQEAYNGFESFSLNNVKNLSFIGGQGANNNTSLGARQASLGQNLANLTRGSSGMQSMHSLSSFCTVNELEKSISYVEKTAKKLLPILIEVKKRMIPDKKKNDKNLIRRGSKKTQNQEQYSDFDDEELLIDLSKSKSNKLIKGKHQALQFDMKNILGYLNQGENLQTLSIGNIMQLQPFKLKDLIEEGKNELELTRESFILKISHMAVSYFCYSTEIRFILQMKEDPSFDAADKQKESEFWHAKSLEIACSFLPGECPLLNHINMSFQKHFAPVKSVIKEDEEEDENLFVVKPLNGIENQRFHPIIKNMSDIDISITPYQMTPLNAVTKPFINQLKSFNDYNESQKSQNNSFINQNSSLNKKSRQQNKAGSAMIQSKNGKENYQKSRIEEPILEGISEDGPSESIEGLKSQNQLESDLKLLEVLFNKVQSQYNVDKTKLFNKLVDQSDLKDHIKQNNKQILNSNKVNSSQNFKNEGRSSKHEVKSIDRQNDRVDFLMDENILTNESREDEQDGLTTQMIRTPNNIKNLNVKGFNQINQSTLANQAAMKKVKQIASAGGSSKLVENQILNENDQQNDNDQLQQRPKTQINRQRNSSNRDQKLQTKEGNNQSIQSNDQSSGAQPSSKNGGTSQQNILQSNLNKYQNASHKFAQQQQIEQKIKKQSQQRPFSGGIQKMIKSDNHKSRVQNLSQKNFSMYEQKGNVNNFQVQGNPQSHNNQQQKIFGDDPNTNLQFSPNKNNLGVRNLNQIQQSQLTQQDMLYQNLQSNQSQQQILKQHYSSQQKSQISQVSSTQNGRQQLLIQNSTQADNPTNQQKQLQILQKQQQLQVPVSNSNVQSQALIKNQLQGAATNIISANINSSNISSTIQNLPQGAGQEHAQYEDLKKRLMLEYKKIQKKSGNSGTPQQTSNVNTTTQGQSKESISQQQPFNSQKIQNQFEQSQQNNQIPQSAQLMSESGNTQSNLNNSTASAHLNIFKQTFIINNSFQPDGVSPVPGYSQQSNDDGLQRSSHQVSTQNNLQGTSLNQQNSTSIPSTVPSNNKSSSNQNRTGSFQNDNIDISQRQQHVLQQLQQHQLQKQVQSNSNSGLNKKNSNQIRSSGLATVGQNNANQSALQLQSLGTQKSSKNNTVTPNQQQMLLMNVLMSQGMDRAQAQAQVQAQIQQIHGIASKTQKDSRGSNNSALSSMQSHQNPSNIVKKPMSSGGRYTNSSNQIRGAASSQEQKQQNISIQQLSANQKSGGISQIQQNYQNQYQNIQRTPDVIGTGQKNYESQQENSGHYQQYIYQNQIQTQKQNGFHSSSSNNIIMNQNPLSGANLPQSSSIVTGGKMIGIQSMQPASSQGNGNLRSSSYQNNQQNPINIQNTQGQGRKK